MTKKVDIDWNNLGFEYIKTDFRYISNWKDGKWDDPSVLAVAKAYEDFAKKGYFSESIASNVWPAGQNQELAAGTAAIYLNGSWLPNEV